jgi:hypothetical protein
MCMCKLIPLWDAKSAIMSQPESHLFLFMQQLIRWHKPNDDDEAGEGYDPSFGKAIRTVQYMLGAGEVNGMVEEGEAKNKGEIIT